MDKERETMIEAAKKFILASPKWPYKVLTTKTREATEWMTDFALQIEQKLKAKIVAELRDAQQQDTWVKTVLAIDRLAAKLEGKESDAN